MTKLVSWLVRRDDSCGMECISKLTVASRLSYVRGFREQPVAQTMCWNGSDSVYASWLT